MGTGSNESVFEINLNSRSIVRTIDGLAPGEVGQNGIIVSPDGRFVYVARNGSVAVIDRVSSSIVRSLPGTQFSFNLQISPDGRNLYVLDFSSLSPPDPSFIVVDTMSGVIRSRMRLPGGFRYMKLSPDGRLLYLNGLEWGPFVMDATTNSMLAGKSFDENGQQGDFSLSGNFNFGRAPQVNVLSPQANEIIQRGRPFTIRWQTTNGGFNIANHKVELSLDGGNTFTTLAPNLTGQIQQFEFTPTNAFINNAQIRITANDLGARTTSVTSASFSIGDRPPGDEQPPTVRFMSPVGGERFTSGDTIMIVWSSSDNVGVSSQELSLSTDGGTTFPIPVASGLGGNVQSFSFRLPDTLQTMRARLRLVVRDAAGNMAQALTPADFQVLAVADTQAPVVTISNPRAGDMFPAGQAITVNWRSIDNINVVSQAVLLSLNGGASFQTVASLDGGAGTFTINNVSGLDMTVARAQVKITATDASGNMGEATTSFVLAPAIMMSNYAKPVLTISGVGFMSADGTIPAVRVLINGVELPTARIKSVSNTSITVQGNKKKLGLVRGTNSVQLIVSGVQSNTSNFQF